MNMQEHTHSINGVEGRMRDRHKWPNGLYMHQSWESAWRLYDGGDYRLRVNIRFDDNCKNGHQTFAITADGQRKNGRGSWVDDICGCCHNEIAEVFPELAYLIPYHLESTDGPMHAVANAVYHASNRDYNGLLKGETRQIRNGRTGKLAWRIGYKMPSGEIKNHYTVPTFDGDDLSEAPELPEVIWQPMNHIGKGKERNFEAVRNIFHHIELSDETLSLEKAELTKILQGHVATMINKLKPTMEDIGFEWVELTKE